MPSRRVLILGGTGEAREIAVLLNDAGAETVTSLAGVTRHPLLPPGEIHRGGFGGAEGLGAYIASEGIAAIVDATHPFAARISLHACAAAKAHGIPCLRLERAAWEPEPGDTWIAAADAASAAAAVPRDARVLVTVGRKEIGAFFARADLAGIARMIEAPEVPIPRAWTVILNRPPFTLEGELELLRAHHIDVLVTKNAGGAQTRAKLAAARTLRIPVVMIGRPVKPATTCFATAERLADALRALLSP